MTPSICSNINVRVRGTVLAQSSLRRRRFSQAFFTRARIISVRSSGESLAQNAFAA
jgi:hypothetical protein